MEVQISKQLLRFRLRQRSHNDPRSEGRDGNLGRVSPRVLVAYREELAGAHLAKLEADIEAMIDVRIDAKPKGYGMNQQRLSA